MITELKQRTALQFRFAAGPALPAAPPNDGALFCLTSKYELRAQSAPIRFVVTIPDYTLVTAGVYVVIADGTPNLSFRSARWGIALELCATSCVVLLPGNVQSAAELYVGRQGKWVKLV